LGTRPTPSSGENMEHKKSTGKIATAIKRSPVIQALQLEVLLVGGVIWQHSLTVSFVSEFRFRHLGKLFYGTELL
jgi:hypothetical protein